MVLLAAAWDRHCLAESILKEQRQACSLEPHRQVYRMVLLLAVLVVELLAVVQDC